MSQTKKHQVTWAISRDGIRLENQVTRVHSREVTQVWTLMAIQLTLRRTRTVYVAAFARLRIALQSYLKSENPFQLVEWQL